MPRQHELSKQPQRSHQSSPQYRGRRAATKLARLSTCLTLAFLSSASGVAAQQSTPFTDQVTGIQFQRFFGARTNFGFGFALPPAGGGGGLGAGTGFTTAPATGATTGATTGRVRGGRDRRNQNQNQKRQTAGAAESFIGQLTFPLVNGAGWGGFSLTGDMEGPLLMAAWSDGKGNVVSSFRQAFNEDDDPPEVTGSFSLRPIAAATSVNNTFLTYTFLCENCLDATLGFGAGAAVSTEMGWALASRAVRNPETSAGVLGFHNSGFGDFRANVGAARNALFDTWAALADAAPVGASRGARAFDTQAGLDGGSDSDSDGGFGGGGGGGFDSDSDSDSDSD